MFRYMYPLAISCVTLLTSHSHQVALADKPTIKELVEGVDRRHAAYFGMRYEYDVRFRTTPAASLLNTVSTRNVFKLTELRNAKSMRIWNCSWVQVSNNAFEGPLLTRFYATENEIEYSFTRWRPGMQFANPLEVRHEGTITARSQGSPDYFDPFRELLFLRFNLVSVLDLGAQQPVDRLNRGMDFFIMQNERVVDGKTIYTLKGSFDATSQTDWIEVEVGDAPDFLIYRVEFFNKNKSGAVYKIQEYSKIGSTMYPTKGYAHHEPFGDAFGFTYEFNATSVQRLSDEDRQAWIPKWPANTWVWDQNSTLPSRSKQGYFITKRELPLASLSKSARIAFFALFGCLVGIVVVVGLWFSWNSDSFARRLAILLIGLAIPMAILERLADQNLAILIVIVTLATSVVATSTRTLFGTSISRMDRDSIAKRPLMENHSRVGFREWSMLVAALLLTVFLTFNADALVIEKAVGMAYALICVSILGILFHRLLGLRLFWAIVTLLASGAGLLICLQMPLVGLSHIPYYGNDHVAWVVSHVVGFTTVATLAAILRLKNYRIGSDWKLSRDYRFSVREIGLWITTVAVLLTIFQLLTRIDLEI